MVLWHEKKAPTGYCYVVAAVYILLNAVATFLLIFYMVQQQQEIKNLREIINDHVHHLQHLEFKSKQASSPNNDENDDTQSNIDVLITNPKVA